MKNTLKIIYTGGLDEELDEKIRTFFEELGMKEYGSGMRLDTQERDIAFDKPITK